jgi:hypothetical protein
MRVDGKEGKELEVGDALITVLIMEFVLTVETIYNVQDDYTSEKIICRN